LHASFPETSLALALDPDLVRREAVVDDGPAISLPYHLIPTPSEALPASGVYGRTTNATASAGAVLRDAVLLELEVLVDDLLSSI
jgi:creatinine amidohydrolase/Fe(II)-dependent formamide hydrolase-like protein